MAIRGMMKKWFMLVVWILVIVVAGEVWGIRAASAATPAKPVKLRMMAPSEPKGGFPYIGGLNGFSKEMEPIAFNVMEPLLDLDKKGESIPKLATRWEHSQDLTKWRFYLRKGVKFHNGDNFTARDVVETAKWMIEEKDRSIIYLRLPVQKAVAVDDYTVDLIFEKPQPHFFINVRGLLIPPVAVARDNRELAKTSVIGTGPYRFVEWKRGMNVRMSKFAGYWGPKPQIDEVEIIYREEDMVRQAALQAGETDLVLAVSPDSSSKTMKTLHKPGDETVYLRIDEYIQGELGGVSVLSDKRLRQAVEYSLDRKALVTLFGGFAIPSLGQFASPGDLGFNPNLKSRPYDLEKARTLVKEAGAVGKTVKFVAASDRFAKGREACEAIAGMIEQTGLKVDLKLMPNEEAQKYIKIQSVAGQQKYIADIVLHTADTFLECETRFPKLFTVGGGHAATRDPEPARLYKEVQDELNLAKRWDKLGKAWAYVYDQTHYIPLFKLEWMWGLAKNLEWDVDIVGRPFFSDMKFTK